MHDEESPVRGNKHWLEELHAAVTVADAAGTIVFMNALSRETFASHGGGALVGKSVFDCHAGPPLGKIRKLYENKAPNHYTIRKKGMRKIIHQLPLFEHGRFAGFVEISIPIPEALPHFERG